MQPQDAIRRIRRQADRLRTLDAVDARTPAFGRWYRETSASLLEIFGPGPGPSREFQLAIFEPASPSKFDPDSDWRRSYEKGVPIALSFFDSVLRDLVERPAEPGGASETTGSVGPSGAGSRPRPDVLVLAGDGAGAGDDVRRFLEEIGAAALVAGEAGSGQASLQSLGRTAVFAVVVLEPGQRAGAAGRKRAAPGSGSGSMRPSPSRMFELGFALGRLSGKKVCALLPDGVELGIALDPSVSVVALDAAGAWKKALADAMKSAGLPIAIDAV